ncbi:MAG: PrsW family intramembrane metalloprotease [Propionicimonas sp.]|nr:PrsW family intramembrane metalloprotease [Propionicimonas sp.]
MTSAPAARLRRLNNLPAGGQDRRPLPQRALTSWWTWLTVGMVIVFAACLAALYVQITADQPSLDGTVPGVNPSAVRLGAWYATSTLAFWIVVFLLADRFRPQRWTVWLMSLGWGGSVATYVAYLVNSWAAMQLQVSGNFDPATSARAAIFVAPFVEEAAKATVLFGLAMLVRYELVSKVSLVVMAGLSAAGFAFTENIIYYARAIVYSSQTINVGDAESAVVELVWLRGFWLAFGHPLFTMMTGLGVAVALRTRSKVVRVLAPLAGYGLAVLGHMVFNSQASLTQGNQQLLVYFTLALPLLIAAVVYVVRQVLKQGRLIRARLVDYVLMGWLKPTDPEVFARLRTRLWALLVALTRGWRVFVATRGLQRTLTELAYLRDAEVRGVIDATGDERVRELLDLSRSQRAAGIDDPHGMKLSLPRLRRRAAADFPPPTHPGPAGLGGSWPAPTSSPVGSQRHSPGDPTWGPPGR